MKQKLLTNWNFMRVLKLAFGFYATYEAFAANQYILLILAALFFYQSIFNVSACGMGGSCSVNDKHS
jgi:uncharacterized membrane protein HdeD (DUF308 family)